MELHLGLALSTHNPSNNKHVQNKRSYEESFGGFSKPLPLLLWNGQPNEEEGSPSKKMPRNINVSNKKNEENDLVGWPPIKSWRKKEFHQQHPHVRNEGMEDQSRGTKPLYVKVNMEGIAIGRQVNLRLYNSYQTLTDSLITMFVKYQKSEEEAKQSYTLTFQNKQGDWLLSGRVPWQSFIATVRRLAIVKNGK